MKFLQNCIFRLIPESYEASTKPSIRPGSKS